jgi:hypothetical protein
VCCEGRVVSVLEGGYGRFERKTEVLRRGMHASQICRENLVQNAVAHLHALVGVPAAVAPPPVLSSASSTPVPGAASPPSPASSVSAGGRGQRRHGRKSASSDGAVTPASSTETESMRDTPSPADSSAASTDTQNSPRPDMQAPPSSVRRVGSS